MLLIWICDRLFLLFIVASVLLPQGLSATADQSIPISLTLLAAALSLHFLRIVRGQTQVSRSAAFYIFWSFFGIVLLAIISALKGNDLANIAVFVRPVLILLAIPAMSDLFQQYSVDRYLRAIALCASVLGVLLFSAAATVMLSGDREMATTLATFWGPTSISFPPGGVRFTISSSFFLVAGLLIALHLSAHRVAWTLAVFPCVLGLLADQTLSLWFATIVAGAWLLVATPRIRHAALPAIGLSLIGVLIAAQLVQLNDFIDWFNVVKVDSVEQKVNQALEALGIFAGSPISGRGIGHVYRYPEIAHLSQDTNLFLENSYVMVLSSGGLVGLFVYGFIYCFSLRRRWVAYEYSPSHKALISCHVAVIVAAIGNPFLWSGSMGLLFGMMLAAQLEPANAHSAPDHAFSVSRRYRGSQLEFPVVYRRLLGRDSPPRTRG